jgi:hypothetical protein
MVEKRRDYGTSPIAEVLKPRTSLRRSACNLASFRSRIHNQNGRFQGNVVGFTLESLFSMPKRMALEFHCAHSEILRRHQEEGIF